MPKGKKKGKKGKKSGKSKSGKSEKPESSKALGDKNDGQLDDEEDDIFVDKEELLKDKLMMKIKLIEEVKEKTETLKRENEILEEECETVKAESEQFSQYITDRERILESGGITLQDYYRSMHDMDNDKRSMKTMKYQQEKYLLSDILQGKDDRISQLNEKIKEFDIYLEQRKDQQNDLSDLENQIQTLRIQQAHDLDVLKQKLDDEFQKGQLESSCEINQTKSEAYRKALVSLKTTFDQVQKDNQEYRHQILSTIKMTKILNIKKFKLQQQNEKLLEDLKFATDFANYREIRQKKALDLEQTKKTD